jgi:hypothetical protein
MAPVLLLGPLVTIVLAALLCRDAEPRAVGGWVFVLLVTITPSLAFADTERSNVGDLVVGCLGLAFLAALLTVALTSAVHRLRPRPRADAAVPPAQIVER